VITASPLCSEGIRRSRCNLMPEGLQASLVSLCGRCGLLVNPRGLVERRRATGCSRSKEKWLARGSCVEKQTRNQDGDSPVHPNSLMKLTQPYYYSRHLRALVSVVADSERVGEGLAGPGLLQRTEAGTSPPPVRVHSSFRTIDCRRGPDPSV